MKRFFMSLTFILILTACSSPLEHQALNVIGKTPAEALKITDGVEQEHTIVTMTEWDEHDVQGVYTMSNTYEPFALLSEEVIELISKSDYPNSQPHSMLQKIVEDPSFHIPLQQTYVTQYDVNFEQMINPSTVTHAISEAYPNADHLTVIDQLDETIHFWDTGDFLIIYEGTSIHYIPHYSIFEALQS